MATKVAFQSHLKYHWHFLLYEDIGYTWISHGKDNFYIKEAPDAKRGVSIKIYLKENEDEFLDKFKISNAVEVNSNHIEFPINFIDEKGKVEQLNAGCAIWTKSKDQITEEEHQNFFREVARVGGFIRIFFLITAKFFAFSVCVDTSDL